MVATDYKKIQMEEPKFSRAKSGKYLTFFLKEEEYGIDILQTKEIITIRDITPVPCVPEFIRGFINLRGRIIPVIDLRIKFKFKEYSDTKRTCIIIVQFNSGSKTSVFGVIVDQMSEVLSIDANQIRSTPAFGDSVDTKFLCGVGDIDGRMILLLNLNVLFSTEELFLIRNIHSSENNEQLSEEAIQNEE